MNDNVPNPYSEGLYAGREDQAREVRRILDADISDDAKIEMLRSLVEAAEQVAKRRAERGSRGWIAFEDGGVVELPDEAPGTAWERHDDPEQQL